MPRAKKGTTKSTAVKNTKPVGELEVGRLMIDALELFKNNCKTSLLSNDFNRDNLETVSNVLDKQEAAARDMILDQVHLLFKD